MSWSKRRTTGNVTTSASTVATKKTIVAGRCTVLKNRLGSDRSTLGGAMADYRIGE